MATIKINEIIPTDAYEYGLGDGEHHFSLSSFAGVELVTKDTSKAGSRYDLDWHFSFGGWTEEGEGRIEFGGPKVQGPHVYMFAKGTMISATPQARLEKIRVDEGDVLHIKGTDYLLTFKDRAHQYPVLTAV